MSLTSSPTRLPQPGSNCYQVPQVPSNGALSHPHYSPGPGAGSLGIAGALGPSQPGELWMGQTWALGSSEMPSPEQWRTDEMVVQRRKGAARGHTVAPGLPVLSLRVSLAGRAPATYESGPVVGVCADAAVDHRYQPVKQPVGVEEEWTLVRGGEAELRGGKMAPPARVPHPGGRDWSRAKPFPRVSHWPVLIYHKCSQVHMKLSCPARLSTGPARLSG